ncbi:hypothetical protein M7I_0601 [Glarea lozoyensis 74030]|uniref:Uncharacterized protein n=1 Tax=Glarea lozoyensis (strain ATCC 74030 / MF5533) TaxID=1104152 RepID=H0EDZ0_GLAL7|nr:hypothetical protein M7I_0601 [Glarea lozoyensis 74030]
MGVRGTREHDDCQSKQHRDLRDDDEDEDKCVLFEEKH